MTEGKKEKTPYSSFYTVDSDDSSRMLSLGISPSVFSPADLPVYYFRTSCSNDGSIRYVRASGIADIRICHSPVPGDYSLLAMYISYSTEIYEECDVYGFRKYRGYDVCISGTDVMRFISFARNYSDERILDAGLGCCIAGGKING